MNLDQNLNHQNSSFFKMPDKKNRYKNLHILQNWASKPDFAQINYLRLSPLRVARRGEQVEPNVTSPVTNVLQDTYTLKRTLQFCKATTQKGAVRSYWTVTSHMPIRIIHQTNENLDDIYLWHRDSFSLSGAMSSGNDPENDLTESTPSEVKRQFSINGFVGSLESDLNDPEKQHSVYVRSFWEPSADQIRQHLQQLRESIRKGRTWTQLQLIQQLSPMIYAWKAYYEGMSPRKQKQCDFILFKMLWRWACRRHPKKSRRWVKQKYFHCIKEKNWIFAVLNSETRSYVCLPSHLAQ